MFLLRAGLEHTTSNEVRAPMRTGFHAQLSVGFLRPRLWSASGSSNISPLAEKMEPQHHLGTTKTLTTSSNTGRHACYQTHKNPPTNMSRYTQTHTLSGTRRREAVKWDELRHASARCFFFGLAPMPSTKIHPWSIDRFWSSKILKKVGKQLDNTTTSLRRYTKVISINQP